MTRVQLTLRFPWIDLEKFSSRKVDRNKLDFELDFIGRV